MSLFKKVSDIPKTFGGRLALLDHALKLAEISFDDDEPTQSYQLTKAEWEAWELLQLLGSDFTSDLYHVLDAVGPAVLMARDTEEAQDVLDAHR